MKAKVNRVSYLRKAWEDKNNQKLTQRRLGKLIGVSVTTVNNWETHLHEPAAHHVVRLLKLFEVPEVKFWKRIEVEYVKETNLIK